MPRFHILSAVSLSAVLLSSAAASALTADEVWRGWQDAAAGVGLSLVAENQVADGGTLTLTGVTLAQAVPTEDGMPELAMTEIVMADQGDGTVAITMGPSLTAELTGETTGTFGFTQTGLVLTAKDAGDGLAYDVAADALNFLSDVSYQVDMFDGSAPQTGSVKVDVGFNAMSGSYTDTPGEDRAFALAVNAGAWTYSIEQVDPFMGSNSVANSESKDFSMTADLVLPAGIDITSDDPAAWGQALRDGLSVAMTLNSAGETTGQVSDTNEFFPYELTMTGGPSQTAASFSGAGLVLTSKSDSMTYAGTSAAIPVERIELGIGPFEIDYRMPLIATTPEDYRFMASLQDVTVNEEAWALVDPAQTLPRDPANLAFDLTGKAAIDVFALAASEETGAPPVMPTIESLNIPTLAINAAGAALTGTGAFTFDNSLGYPQPLGKADLKLTGGNALVDGLVAIGVLTEQDAQGARMMMAMFMTPGAAPDELTSTIEARDDGGIYVNGQRIQ